MDNKSGQVGGQQSDQVSGQVGGQVLEYCVIPKLLIEINDYLKLNSGC